MCVYFYWVLHDWLLQNSLNFPEFPRAQALRQRSAGLASVVRVQKLRKSSLDFLRNVITQLIRGVLIRCINKSLGHHIHKLPMPQTSRTFSTRERTCMWAHKDLPHCRKLWESTKLLTEVHLYLLYEIYLIRNSLSYCPTDTEKSLIYIAPKYYTLTDNILLPKTLVINSNICLLFSYRTLCNSKEEKEHYGKT